MLPSETMIWQPEFTDKTLSRKPGAVHTALIQHQPTNTTHLMSEALLLVVIARLKQQMVTTSLKK
ncbi:hypothetical protein AW089_19625 [Escherichia coli]|nr:hypothetical protein AW089_19625 [Escherichia coli]